MEHRTVSFSIEGKRWTDDDLLVVIPIRYKDKFDGHAFPDMHTFSMALMHAGCAAEARYYNMPWKVEEYERDLEATLAK